MPLLTKFIKYILIGLPIHHLSPTNYFLKASAPQFPHIYPAVDVTGDRSKVQCCKEQYCMGTWNVRSMNQGKLEVAKQEMARVNTDIKELKWTGI